MSHVFGFLPKAKQEVITEFGLDKAYSTDKKDFIKDLLVFKNQLYSRSFTPEEINGIVIFARGEQPKSGMVKNSPLEHYPYGINTGWKIHITVNPQNYMFVWLWLKFNCDYGWKHTAYATGKEFTVYTYSWENNASFSRKIFDGLNDKLEEPTEKMKMSHITLLGKITTRFNFVGGTKGVILFPSGLGWLGIPTLDKNIRFPFDHEAEFEQRKKYYVEQFIRESIRYLLAFFFKGPKGRVFFLGKNDIVLNVIESSLNILPD